MKIKKISGIWLSLLYVLASASCSEKEIKSLDLYSDSFEVPVNGIRYLGLKSGNGDYTLNVKNQELVSASVSSGWPNPEGTIQLYGKQTGETDLLIMDNETEEIKTLHVKVTDNYETFHVSEYGSNHPALKGDLFVFFINNKERDAYFFKLDRDGASYQFTMQAKGTYAFTMQKGLHCLTLAYPTGKQGDFGPENTELLPHKFLITGGNKLLFHRLNENLHIGWDPIIPQPALVSTSLRMKLKEEGTEFEAGGWLEEASIPKDVLE